MYLTMIIFQYGIQPIVAVKIFQCLTYNYTIPLKNCTTPLIFILVAFRTLNERYVFNICSILSVGIEFLINLFDIDDKIKVL